MIIGILIFTAIVVLLCLAICSIAWTIRFCYTQIAYIETAKKDRELAELEENLLKQNQKYLANRQNVR